MASLGSSKTERSMILSGLFRDRLGADRGYQVLLDLGYGREEISVLMADQARERHLDAERDEKVKHGTKAAEGAGVGGGIGAAVGAAFAALAAIGTSIAVPGLGLVVAGPIAAALAGAGAGGVTGGLIGALVGSGIPEEKAKNVEEAVKEGGIWLSVVPRSAGDADRIIHEWERVGGVEIQR